MRYAPGQSPKNPLPAAPTRPTMGVRPMQPGVTPKPAPAGVRTTAPTAAVGMGMPAPLGIRTMAPNSAVGMKKGGKVSSASKRADGCAVKGKTKGKMV